MSVTIKTTAKDGHKSGCEVCGAFAYPGPLCQKCSDAEQRARESRQARRRYTRFPDANPWRWVR